MNYKYITTNEQVDEAVNVIFNEKQIAIDTETTGLDPFKDKVRLIQIAIQTGLCFIFDMFKLDIEYTISRLKTILCASNVLKVYHNARFDLGFLCIQYGLVIRDYIYDTLIASQVLAMGVKKQHSLKALSIEYLGLELNKEEQLSDWTVDELTASQLEYASQDALVLFQMRDIINLNIAKYNLKRVAHIEFETIPAVVQMETTGFNIDWESINCLLKTLEENRDKILSELKLLFLQVENFNSPKQMIEALNRMGINICSTDETILKPLAKDYKAVEVLLNYKKIVKHIGIVSKLIKSRNPTTNRLHSKYNQNQTATGRFSCYSPSIQQIPNKAEFRSCFIASVGHKLVVADYSQIELRIAAEITDDPVMIRVYSENGDIHKETASKILNKSPNEVTGQERQLAKAINFGLIYGMQAKTLIEYAFSGYKVILSETEAVLFREKFFDHYIGIRDWHRMLNETRPNSINTLSGRCRIFPDGTYLPKLANTPVQGTGADILKRALALVYRDISKIDAKIIGTVHDEIIVECRIDDAEVVALMVKSNMEKAGREFIKKVPIIADVSICDNWGDK